VADVVQAGLGQAPEWVAAEMPPGYQTRLFEIQRLADELRSMDLIGRVLWETGEPLREAVAALLGTLECEVEAGAGPAGSIVVALSPSRRILLVVSPASGPIQKTGGELAQAFQAVQFASPGDRVVLVANTEPAKPPADRTDPVLPDALEMLQRMGVDVVASATLFRLWRLSHEDRQKARRTLDLLHDQDGGTFAIAAR